jgi:hypothetical protein
VSTGIGSGGVLVHGDAGGGVGGGELRGGAVGVLARVAEAVLEAGEQAGAFGVERPRAPGLRAVGVDAQDVQCAAGVDVGDEDDLVGFGDGPVGGDGVGEAAVQLVDPQAELGADAQEVGGAVAVHVGELPAICLGHRGDAGHVDRVVEEAEADAGGDEDAAVGGEDADEIGDAVAVDVGELDAGVAEAHARRVAAGRRRRARRLRCRGGAARSRRRHRRGAARRCGRPG